MALKRALPRSYAVPSLRAMREFIRHLLLILCALAFFGGTTISLVVPPAAAGEPCAEHHGGSAGMVDHHHGKQSGNCLGCCVGSCVAVPGLPPRLSSSVVPLKARVAMYWGNGAALAGRSVAPDLGPPRLSV